MTTATMPEDLYDCYLLFIKESKNGILEIMRIKKNKDFFLETQKPKSRQAFNRALTKMKPQQRREFEKVLRTPYQQQMEDGMRAAEQALHEYETDPKVRELMDKEVEAALAKAFTPRKR